MQRSAVAAKVLERLVAEAQVVGDAADLVEAALDGAPALAAALARPAPAAPRPPPRPPRSPVVWLRRVAVRGFRGIGPEVALDLLPGPGLVLVVGRNGSGKSSLAEALEVLLTGDSRRVALRGGAWPAAWRNLGAREAPRIAGTFVVEGGGTVAIERAWPAGSALREARVEVRTERGPVPGGLAALGWEGAVATWRPVLGAPELERMFDGGPPVLFDALRGLLGLEEVVAAIGRLADARRRERQAADLEPLAAALRERLAGDDDPRAAAARAALSSKPPDLAALAPLLAESEPSAALRALAALVPPDPAAAHRAAARLREAAVEAERAAAAASEADARAAEVLAAALDWHAAHGDGPCPACLATPLDAAWRARAEGVLAERRDAARAAATARERLRAAEEPLRAVLAPFAVPACPEVDTAPLAAAVDRLARARALGGRALADHAPVAIEDLARAVAEAAGRAAAALARDGRGAPLAAELRAFVDRARDAEAAAHRARRLERAERWLAAVEAQLRDEAFEPLAKRACWIWDELGRASAVELSGIHLGGRPPDRIELDALVDGAATPALSVMSQGEIDALALALFLPRATQDASPFRFVLVDDPVRALDAAKVDRLARLLADEARRRQVIVFTHDPRLEEAVRRLRLPARVIEVTRRAGSTVELREGLDPVARQLDDAHEAARAEALGETLAGRVVPGLCRAAVEARLAIAIRRRRLGRGDPHAAVEAELGEARSLVPLLALALFDDPSRGPDVLVRLDALRPRAGETVRRIRDAVHQGDPRPLDLVDETRALVRALDEVLP